MKSIKLIAGLALLVFLVLSTSCSSLKKSSKSVLPKNFSKGVYLGMPLDEFLKVNKTAAINDDIFMDFRQTWEEQPSSGKFENIIYYFDQDGEKPLYEIIMDYRDPAERDQDADKLFGSPNYDGDEWRLTRPNSYNVWSWTYKNKLIVVGMFPDTEWSDSNW